MSGDKHSNLLQICGLSQLPETFAQTVACVESWALQQLGKEGFQKKLYYHTQDHARNVRRRSHQILETLYSVSQTEAISHQNSLDFQRIRLLLDLCAAAHDMVQLFEQNKQKNMPRRRLPGRSEAATLEQLIPYIHQINRLLKQHDFNSSVILTDADIAMIQEAINATICTYIPLENAIYQPLLYQPAPISIVAHILALADLGALGMEGIDAYAEEGSLLFLEENPDIVSLLENGSIHQLEAAPDFSESIRQRLLRRSRFQVSFAKSRLARLQQELQGFPEDAIRILTEETFQYLNPATIQVIETTTPTKDDVDLKTLLQFFKLESYAHNNQP